MSNNHDEYMEIKNKLYEALQNEISRNDILEACREKMLAKIDYNIIKAINNEDNKVNKKREAKYKSLWEGMINSIIKK